MIKDMTKGKPSRVLLAFSLPMFFSVICQQLYNMTDSIVVGKVDGEGALAAIGASYPVTMIFMGIAIGGSIGCNIVISHLFGAKDYSHMKCAVSTGIISLFCIALTLTVIGAFAGDSILMALGTPDDIFEESSSYLNIYIYGLVFLFLYNAASGAFTALGDSLTPLFLLFASSALNIVLDIVFVVSFGWGVKGVAWATFIAQSISCVTSLVLLLKRIEKRFPKVPFERFSFPMLARIMRISIPSMLQNSFVSVGNIFVQSVINSFETAVIAGYSASIKLNTFFINSIISLTNALSSYTAQNIGAGKQERVMPGLRANGLMALLIVIPVSLAFSFLPKYAALIFLDSDSAEAMDAAVAFLRIVSPFYFVVAAKLLCDSVNRGAGCMSFYMISTFFDLILRVILCFAFAPAFGYEGVFFAWPVGWIASAILAAALLFSGKWRTHKAI